MVERPLRGDAPALLKVRNGTVISYDETGVVLQLADSVVADIAGRIEHGVDPEVLGDIDAWDVRQKGDWYHFNANLGGGPRAYSRAVDGGAIVAQAAGPLFGLLCLGGARRAGFLDRACAWPHHVVVPGDDIGAVGMEGADIANASADLAHGPVTTREMLTAERMLSDRQAQGRALPVFYARTETDFSAHVDALGCGTALESLLIQAANLKAAAATLGKRAKIMAVSLDFCAEDVVSDPRDYLQGMYDLMAHIETALGALGYHKPLFVLPFDANTRIKEQWELAALPSDHDCVMPAPSYMFEYDAYMRPKPDAMVQMAEMDAFAIEAINRDEAWACPVVLLAEQDGDVVRVTCQAMGDLILDGPHGFSIEGVEITNASIDGQDVLLTCDHKPKLGAILQYSSGGLRDDWSAQSATGVTLHRWALPCEMKVF